MHNNPKNLYFIENGRKENDSLKEVMSNAPTIDKLSELVFFDVDFPDQDKMLQKLDFLINAWGRELVHKGYMEQTPISDSEWISFLDMDIYWGDLKDQWDHYIVGCLIFFVMLRSDIRRDFLLQPDYIRSRRMSRWLEKLRRYMNPLLRNTVTEFCMCYSMIMEKKPIRVRFNEFNKASTLSKIGLFTG